MTPPARHRSRRPWSPPSVAAPQPGRGRRGLVLVLAAVLALPLWLVACAVPEPGAAQTLTRYVAPPAGQPRARLLLRTAGPAGAVFQVLRHEDALQCLRPQLVVAGSTSAPPPAPVEVAAGALSTMDLVVVQAGAVAGGSSPGPVSRCTTRWSFTPQAGHSYAVLGQSQGLACAARLVDVTAPDRPTTVPDAVLRIATGRPCVPVAQAQPMDSGVPMQGGQAQGEAVLNPRAGTQELRQLVADAVPAPPAVAAGGAAPASAPALGPAELFARVSPSVWRVQTLDADGLALGQGSAVVVGPGQLVTNCHVLARARRVLLRREAGVESRPARLAAWDVQRDLCQLQASGITAPAVPLAAADGVRVGQPAYAIGHPKGLDLTMSAGLVSSLRHNSAGQRVLLQTSAAISGGSSGGGLFNEQGALLGLTTLASVTGDAQNLNFAIPADWIADLPRRHAAARQAEAASAAAAASRPASR